MLATVVVPEGSLPVANGYMRQIALVVLNQGGNIIISEDLSVTEQASPANDAAQALYGSGKAGTTNSIPISQQPNGVFYDLQIIQQSSQRIFRLKQDLYNQGRQNEPFQGGRQ